tara:strand:- start:101 stop:436 length:336 start_codon:yes stop_codon:yes gene_type:complete
LEIPQLLSQTNKLEQIHHSVDLPQRAVAAVAEEPMLVLLEEELAAVEKMVLEVLPESVHTLILTVVETHLIVVSEDLVVLESYLQYMLLQVVLVAAAVVPVVMVTEVNTLP